MSNTILKVQDLNVSYKTDRGINRAVKDFNLEIKKGETFGIVGESGCGKSTLAMAILRLLQSPGYIEKGSVILGAKDLLKLESEELRKIRWSHIALILQGSMNSLNPVMRIKNQIGDVIITHEGKKSRSGIYKRMEKLLDTVKLSPDVLERYPHELSGGMKQRVCIAMAIALKPSIVVADEPTNGLDVVAQRVVMETIMAVQEELNLTLVLIGHDISLQAQFSDRFAVMYAGQLMAIGPVEDMFSNAVHPYASMLISATPSIKKKDKLKGIPGLPPSFLKPPSGCPFHPRCPEKIQRCTKEIPEIRQIKSDMYVACHIV